MDTFVQLITRGKEEGQSLERKTHRCRSCASPGSYTLQFQLSGSFPVTVSMFNGQALLEPSLLDRLHAPAAEAAATSRSLPVCAALEERRPVAIHSSKDALAFNHRSQRGSPHEAH
ncbi:hypothetical protein IRJ41_008909 [Triplophysa rosa]|uniref:Uncharacterized protein n=1 Tax=Triplophysa rosa TaxID=992332 RepID=A0A9W8C9U1_TRIRA|nr:hypothetical protein IRJ41_008909 [Triplophysa rosa]